MSSNVEIPTIWIGVVGPAGLPQAIVQRLNAEMIQVLKEPQMTEFLRGAALTPLPSTPAQMDAQIKSDIQAWGEVIRKLGIKLD